MREPLSRRSVTVTNENGLHLVPCSLIAQRSREHACDVAIRKGEYTVDAKNVLELMTLNAAVGTELEIVGGGEGADAAVDDLVALFVSGFVVEDAPENEN